MSDGFLKHSKEILPGIDIEGEIGRLELYEKIGILCYMHVIEQNFNQPDKFC